MKNLNRSDEAALLSSRNHSWAFKTLLPLYNPVMPTGSQSGTSLYGCTIRMRLLVPFGPPHCRGLFWKALTKSPMSTPVRRVSKMPSVAPLSCFVISTTGTSLSKFHTVFAAIRHLSSKESSLTPSIGPKIKTSPTLMSLNSFLSSAKSPTAEESRPRFNASFFKKNSRSASEASAFPSDSSAAREAMDGLVPLQVQGPVKSTLFGTMHCKAAIPSAAVAMVLLLRMPPAVHIN
mmetsp:Transcript_44500/g.81282  ORF Transcript_44500/g.81282 Transcript_44500/m.81282 type:complete len:234 (-) Transcript_44500:37-738(-)